MTEEPGAPSSAMVTALGVLARHAQAVPHRRPVARVFRKRGPILNSVFAFPNNYEWAHTELGPKLVPLSEISRALPVSNCLPVLELPDTEANHVQALSVALCGDAGNGQTIIVVGQICR